MTTDGEAIEHGLRFLSARIGLFRVGQRFFFEPTEDVYTKLKSGDEADLQVVTTSISSHLGIQPVPGARYDWGIKTGLETAGQARLASRRVRIPFFSVGNAHIVGAILAHELVHFFLSDRDIWLDEPEQNEPLTDLATILLGLGKLYLNGLVSTPVPELPDRTVLGYTPVELVSLAYDQVVALRDITPEEAEDNLTLDARRLLRMTGATSGDRRC